MSLTINGEFNMIATFFPYGEGSRGSLLCSSTMIIIFVEIYVRTNFRALALRENRNFSRVFIFAHLQILRFQKPGIWQYKWKIGLSFAKIYLRFIFMCKSVEIQYLWSDKKRRTAVVALTSMIHFRTSLYFLTPN